MKGTWWVSDTELLPEQKDIIKLPLDGSYLIVGPPGSGKTNVLLLRANYLHLAGHPNLNVLVFTKALREFISYGGNKYDFPTNRILTSQKWYAKLLHQHGIHSKLTGGFEDQRKGLVDMVREELLYKRKLQHLFETLLLDEAHDYWPAEIEIFATLAKNLYAVADSHQKIYSGPDSMDALRQAVKAEHHLQYHFRMGLNICRFADAVGTCLPEHIPLTPTANYNEKAAPSSYDVFGPSTLEGQVDKLAERLPVQQVAYPDELIGILCPTNAMAANVHDLLKKRGISAVLHVADDHPAFTDEVTVCVSTIHSAKGLEYRAVHLIMADKISVFDHSNNVAYTAVTRPKTTLSIYHSGSMPLCLEQAIASTQAPPPLPKIKDLFGKKGGS